MTYEEMLAKLQAAGLGEVALLINTIRALGGTPEDLRFVIEELKKVERSEPAVNAVLRRL